MTDQALTPHLVDDIRPEMSTTIMPPFAQSLPSDRTYHGSDPCAERISVATRKTKSPLKDRPLRNPGESVQEAIFEHALTRMFLPWIWSCVFTALALIEWGRWYFRAPPNPWFVTGLAVVADVVGILFWRSALKRLDSLRLGRDGERAVGQFMEKLRTDGAEVFHDVLSRDFNIDHVVIAPQGVFTIETKTWSKPDRGKPEISFEGDRLLKNGFPVDRDPMPQALAQATWMREFLRDSAGRELDVRPVVVFPGWMVGPGAFESARKKGVWLLNPRALPGFLEKLQPTLSSEDIWIASYHLGRYIRTTTSTGEAITQPIESETA